MGKLLTAKDKILLGLALVGDAFDEARLLGGLVSSAYRNVYGWTPPQFRKQRFYESVSRMFKTGDIEKVIKGGESYLRLVSRGKKRLIRDFPILRLQGQKWDKHWTLVAFDIAEVSRFQRDFLRRKLVELGFGMYQRSLYISPYNWVEDLREFVTHYKIFNVRVFRSQEVIGGDQKAQACNIWKLGRLNEEYGELVKKAEEISKLPRGPGREKVVRRLRSRYLDVLLSDPCLPSELFPDDWFGEKARKLIIGLK